ncbi:hypothetical protein FRC08_002227 [Ceratobasidium sp. 394]|nr:hypothetical protein FRC08_002227 [Ceratobasidium sp. 394]
MARKNRAKSDAQRTLSGFRERKGSSSDVQSPVSPLFSPKLSLRETKDTLEEEPSKTPEEWIDFALKKLWESGKPIHAIRVLAMQEPDLLEFLVTANEEIRDEVRRSVCNSGWFPATRDAWTGSLSSMLLERFRTYLNRLPPHLADRQIDDACRHVPNFVAALAALDAIAFGGDSNAKDKEDDDVDPFFKKKQSQKKRKAAGTARARQNTTLVDPRLFTAIDFDMPTSPDELSVTEICLLNRLRELLEVLLDSFARPELAIHAKALFFKETAQYAQVNTPNSSPVLPTSGSNNVNTSTTSAPGLGAFPHIRPLGAAKYFDNASELGAWPVVVSGRAVAHLRQIQKGDNHVFRMVRKKITELSQGFFSDDNQKRLLGLETEVPIYEAKVSRDLRIVYQIDLDTDVDTKVDKQIIKLYGVYTHAQLDNRLWSLVSHYHINRRGKEYRRRCLYRTTHRAPGQNVTMPAQFPHEEDLEIPVEVPSKEVRKLDGMTDEDFLELHSLIALEKFIPMSQTLIDSILNDSDSSHVFHVSPKEKEIIYHQSACFVLGRSGTGKTTSIVFKMIGIEKLFEQMEEVTKPRQVFVTQSRVLAQRVQEYYNNLVSAASATSSRPQQPDEEHVLADLDDEDAGAFGLPAKYSQLEDKHFPLFLTYDQLCSLLEADFGLQFRRSARTKAHIAAEQRFAIQEVADVKIDLDQAEEVEQTNGGDVSPVDTREDVERARRAAVTFEIFVAAYWPHFDYRLTKGLDPALVYSEFLGIIEGSESALGSTTGALGREAYTSLSHRKSSFASQRDRIYDLYEIYRKRKQAYGGYDAAERTHALISTMNGRVPGPKLDCLYVDEAQDNLLIDIKLLHNLSNNPHGIFMAGDTAQTISAGSSFRFEDLSAFLWRLEEQDEAVRCGKRGAIHPTLFHLAVNYRSHGGIVDCASSVVQLISDLFPYSIDKLSKETGLIDGPKPIFFSGWDRGVVRFEQFLRGEADTKIDFGASQVILVRNEAAREALREQVGEIGLILTLYESKGLEFDDVLLYNFFEDSTPAASTWRVILHGLQGVNTGPVPRFDEIRHAVICTELKNLYVGLTRARNHCWIWDVSEKAEPMKTFWSKKELITLCGPEDPMPQLSVSSSEADWAKSGRLLFNKRLYPQAMFCFDKAGLELERDIAAAYQARKEARLLLAKSASAERQTWRNSFTKAAKDFLGCAILSKGKQQISCYLRAAECFLQAEDWKLAAESYCSAEEFDLAAKNFRRAGCFVEAVDVVKKHKDQVQKSLAAEIIGIARLEFLRKSQYERAAGLFDDVEEQLDYMEDYGFDAARIHVLEHHKRYGDAAEVALRDYDLLECIRLLSCSGDRDLLRQALSHAIRGLWITMPYGSVGSQLGNPAVALLLEQLSKLDLTALNEDEHRQLESFQAFHTKKADRIVALARANAALSRAPEALLCFAQCSRGLVALHNATIPTFISNSVLAMSYYNGLAALVRNFKASCVDTQRLLGFELVQSHADADNTEGEPSLASEFRLLSSSILFDNVKAVIGDVESTPFALGLNAVMVSESDIVRLATTTISDKLKSEVQSMHFVANGVRYIQPCLDFAIFGNCKLSYCGRHELNTYKLADDVRQTHFNERLRAHILQILIIHSYQAQATSEYQGYKWTWIRKLYETLLPQFPPLGSVLCAESTKVRELNQASGVIANWCEHNLHDIWPGRVVSRFVTDVLVLLELAYRVNRQSFAVYGPRLHSMRLVNGHPDLIVHVPDSPGRDRSIIHHFIDFYLGRSEDALKRAIHAAHRVLFRPLMIEINVLVHLLESIGRELIVQTRIWTLTMSGVFNGVILPQSWALDIVQHAPQVRQQGWSCDLFMDCLYKTLEYLRAYEPGTEGKPSTSTLYGFHGPPSLLLRGVLILRICRLLILIAINLGLTSAGKNLIRVTISRLLTGSPGVIHNALCVRFARADSWFDLESALYRCQLNRGSDQLVYILHRNSNPPRGHPFIKQVIYNEVKDLENMLSLASTNQRQGVALNPQAKSFIQAQTKVDATAPNEQENVFKQDSDPVEAPDDTPDQPAADAFAGLIPPQVNYLAAVPKSRAHRALTAKDLEAGKRILFCYRRYSFRQRVAAWFAVRTIWSCYSRYRLRNKVRHTATDDRIRKFHSEYKKDAEGIECPLLYAKAFRRHEQILLGPMPHVAVYFRGLERIVQRQKESNKKRLQKVQHEELERVQIKMTICSTLSKTFKKLTPKILPGRSESALLNINTLREKVQEVDALRTAVIRGFGENAISPDLELQYQLGVYIILAPSAEPRPPKPPKPDLNTSDLGI